MTAGTSRTRAIGAALALALGLATASTASGESNGSQGHMVEGTWYIQVTLRVCATGMPVPGTQPVNSLVTFARGGTLAETAGGTGFAPGQRSPGHGFWHHKRGHTYSQKFTALINFASAGPPPVEAGWQTVTHTVHLIDRDNLESSGTNAFYRADGSLYRTGCSTAVGKRFE